MTRTNAYVSDITYQVTFFEEQTPAHLNFACLLGGCEPVALDKPFTYMELGCGQGLTSNVLAATHPHARFFACDFNPAHVASARELAEAANLDNIVFLEESFEDLAAGKLEDLPRFDFITMYGVYSWVDAENRRHIVDFIKRYLKPGGIVYANYNAMPGWSAASVLQRLSWQHVELHPEGSAAQIDQMRAFVQQLHDAGPRFFSTNAGLSRFMDSFSESSKNYLAHEYLNRGWSALYHADVARDMAGAKLDYAASAQMICNVPELHLTPEQQRFLETIAHGPLRETARDCILNASLRQDIFVRGARSVSATRLAMWMSKVGLALARPYLPADMTLQAAEGLGKLHAPVLEALKKRPHRLSELASLPPFAGQPAPVLLKAAARLISSGAAAPYFVQAAAIDPAPAHRLNMELARRSETSDEYQVLASPLLGGATAAGLFQRLVYAFAAKQGKDVDAELISRHIADVVAAQRASSVRNGQANEGAAYRHEEILSAVQAILAHRLPIWVQHGAVGGCKPMVCGKTAGARPQNAEPCVME
jgi:SAM-dependent methyltransferase